MRPIALPTIIVALAATACSLLALSPWIQAGVEPVQAAQEDASAALLLAAEDGPVEVTLTTLFADPEPFLGREVRFVSQVEERPDTWNPYLTRFGRVTFGALRVWGDEQRLWLPEDYESSQGLIFCRRTSRAWERVAEVPPYGRVEFQGVVRQIFLGRPWIEVTRARVLPLALSEGALIHASRGVALMKAGQYPFAANEFERARATTLPVQVELELAELEERCRAVEADPR